MKITVDDLRRHGIEKHSLACTRDLCLELNIDFRRFVREGVDHTELLPATKNREDVREFLDFMGIEYADAQGCGGDLS